MCAAHGVLPLWQPVGHGARHGCKNSRHDAPGESVRIGVSRSSQKLWRSSSCFRTHCLCAFCPSSSRATSLRQSWLMCPYSLAARALLSVPASVLALHSFARPSSGPFDLPAQECPWPLLGLVRHSCLLFLLLASLLAVQFLQHPLFQSLAWQDPLLASPYRYGSVPSSKPLLP